MKITSYSSTYVRQGVQAVADPETFGVGDDKIYKHGFSIGLISKFRMFMINLLDVAQICLAYF